MSDLMYERFHFLPQQRPEVQDVWTAKGYVSYLAVMLGFLLTFQIDAVVRVTGISFERYAIFTLAHVAITTIDYRVAAFRKFTWYWNPLFTSALPFLASPMAALAWIFFCISAVNDGVVMRRSFIFLTHIVVSPQIVRVLAVSAGLHGVPSALGLIPISLLGGLLYWWIASVLDSYEVIAAENARLHEQSLRRQERERIAADLHDGFGAVFTGLALRARVAAVLMKESPGAAAAAMIEVSAITRGALQTAQTAAASISLAPMAVSELGELIRATANAIAGGAVLTVEASGDLRLGPEMAHHILMLASEAAANAVRHGNAQSIAIRLDVFPGGFELRVKDDGQGFSAIGRPQLRTLARRVRLLQGRITFPTGSGPGVDLVIQVGDPIAAQA